MKIETTLKVSIGLVVVVMSMVAAVPYYLEVKVEERMAQQVAMAQRERDLMALRNLMRDMEAGQLGYIITGREEFLRPYYAALDALPPALKSLRERMQDDTERAMFGKLEQAIDQRLQSADETVEVRRNSGFNAAHDIVSTLAGGRDQAQIAAVRTLIGANIDQSAALRNSLRQQVVTNIQSAANISLAGTLANVALLFMTLFFANSALRKSKQAETSARNAAEALELSSHLTTARNEQLAGSSELMHALDLAETVEESSLIISRYFGRLLPRLSGSLYLYRNSRDILERKAQWGRETDDCNTLELLDCWGLRRGGQHFADSEHAIPCRHSEQGSQLAPRLCLPLVAQGDVIGCITVFGQDLAGESGMLQKQFIIQLAEQVALSMSNAQLRLKLRQQSIIDPLTELYNRRYMDESLKRELLRARRKQGPLSLILVDLDHFKRVNDTYGHDIGDQLLRKVGEVLRHGVRAVDIACRFGGEELVVILPDCDQAAAMQRAESLRAAVAAIELNGKAAAHTVTASFGVACSAIGHEDADTLLRGADHALYSAKQSGRNRVVAATAAKPAPAMEAAAA